MRILQICHKPPYPAVDGASIAMYNLYRGLVSAGHEVHVLAMNTYKQFCDINKVPDDFREASRYTLVYTDIRVRAIPAFLNLLSGRSYNLVRFDRKAVRNAIDTFLGQSEYDFVILESLFATAYIDQIRRRFKGPVILRSHNVEFNIWNNLAGNERNLLKKWYLGMLAHRLKKEEIERISRVDLVASISRPDISVFKQHGCRTPMEYIPFGINFSEEKYRSVTLPGKEELVFFHVGSMDWIPHQEAFHWFLHQIWIPFSKKYPKGVLHLAGSKMPSWILQGNFPNVIVERGYVDGHRFMKGKAMMVVPSLSGSGIRIKIAEGMALGKVIITTTNGAMGIPCSHNENIFISDDPEEWIALMGNCLEDHMMVQTISRNARRFAEKEFNYESAAQRLAEQAIQCKVPGLK